MQSEAITDVSSITFEINDSLLSPTLVQSAKDSVAFTNPEPAKGGSAGQTVREVRESALAHFQAQQRNVTKEDYIVRAYSLPAKFGSIAKVHFVQDDQLNKSEDVADLEREITEEDISLQ